MPRFGVFVLAGKPNAGKSTLLNALIDQPLAITSHKPQSTRLPVVGIRTEGDAQVAFVDPPGLLAATYALQRGMISAALEALSAADAVLHVHPITDGPPPPLESLLASRGQPFALPRLRATVLSQADRAPREQPARDERTFVVSARSGLGVADLLSWCLRAAPEGSFRYPEDDVSTQPIRFFAAEYVREAAFELLSEEVPYALAVEVEEFREGSDPLYVRLALFVERDSQRGIVIGEGGRTLRTIGTSARQRLEKLVDQRVYLDLWVKVLHNWRSRPHILQRFGFPIPSKEPG